MCVRIVYFFLVFGLFVPVAKDVQVKDDVPGGSDAESGSVLKRKNHG